MIRWLFRAPEAFVTHLEAEIEWYRLQLVHERNRADRAVDTLLAMQGVAAVTPPPPRNERVEMEQEIARVLGSQEFQGVGAVE